MLFVLVFLIFLFFDCGFVFSLIATWFLCTFIANPMFIIVIAIVLAMLK